jgi:hypothetical protein
VRDRDVLPADQSLDVRFDDFMTDEWGTVERIYEKAGQPFPDSSRAALHAYNDNHRRNRFGRVRYDVSTFGIDPAERESALAGYRERFGV